MKHRLVCLALIVAAFALPTPAAVFAADVARVRVDDGVPASLDDTAPTALEDSGSEDADRAPWTRSIVCPILYTHEIVSQPVFRRFAVGMLNSGYHPISLATLDKIMVGDTSAPARCLVLSFDDSLMSQYLNAVPVLTDLGLPAVFFALPNFADGVHRYMGVTELQAIAGAGYDVELHTCNHPSLPLLARRNLAAFYAELAGCQHILADITGRAVDYLAYPSGEYDATVLEAVARFGFRAGFTTRPSAFLDYRSPFTLPRIRYDASESPGAVIARIRAAGG